MSNFSQVQQASRDALRAIAVGEARGAQSITVYALLCGKATMETVWSPADAAALYTDRFGWVNAERSELGKDPLKVPQGKSLAAQVSKFRSVMELGAMLKDRPETWDAVVVNAANAAGHHYKKTLSSVGAVRTVLLKDPSCDDAELLGDAMAAQEATEAAPETAGAAFEKIAKGWDTLCADHSDLVKAVSAKRPAVASDLAAMMQKFGTLLNLVEAERAAMGV